MGSGGFADVWKAKDKDTNSSIALKIYTNLDDDGINDLASEYTRMQNLNHTNILKADYFARWGNIPYLVMKVCEGGSLSKKVGCIDDTELMHVVQDIAEGLTYLSVEPYSIYSGNPAKFIKKRFSDEKIEFLLKLEWWNWSGEEIFDNLEILTSEAGLEELMNKYSKRDAIN